MPANQLGIWFCRFMSSEERRRIHELTDQELLEHFVGHRDNASFEILMARHGPMVLNVCRRVLSDANDVEDAFQATFVVLVRKARSIRKGKLLANWLYGVAHRTSARARVEA